MRQLVLFTLVSLCAAAAIPGPTAAEETLTLGGDLTLPDPAGKPTRIDFAAAPLTLVNFWATWCMPCREEMPAIVKLLAKHKGKGLRVIGVALESGEPAQIKSFLDENKELGINYPILVGDDTTPDKFGGIEIVPTTYLVDRRGRVVKRYFGVSHGFAGRVGADIREALGEGQAPSGR